MSRIRKDIASLGTWSDTLIWYAKAVGAVRKRAITERTSWLYLAAIHGMDLDGWIAQDLLPEDPSLPPSDERKTVFDQCQHAGWYFLPWHRGYLAAFESILGDWIAQNGGPSDWGLPYWNYLNADNPDARDIPQEFRDTTLPNSSDPNPLAQALRGPATRLGPEPWIPVDITLDAQTGHPNFTASAGAGGYGGGATGFVHFGSATGAVEQDPHNYVHVMVGGDNSSSPKGWMYDPNFAGLDPIFWMHHCNIDRLWEAWMSESTNHQETGAAWSGGPFPRQFEMPDSSGNLNVFTPADTLPGGSLAPNYDNLTAGTGISPTVALETIMTEDQSDRGAKRASLVAANTSALSVGAGEVQSKMAFRAPRARSEETVLESTVSSPSRYFLNVEGVRGAVASGVFTVKVSAPNAEGNGFEKTFVLFGIAKASDTVSGHSGNGLSSTVDVTEALNALLMESGPELESLDIRLKQEGGTEQNGQREITVDRVSIYEEK